MRKRRPGTRLAVAVPEHWPRWVNIFLFFLAGSAGLAPTVWFLLDRSYTTFGLLEGIFGVLGAFSLVIALRLWALALLAGATTVEISREPAVVGAPLDYWVRQGRVSSLVRAMEARLVLRRYGLRSGFTVELSKPLAAERAGPDGRRQIEGSLVVPPCPESSPVIGLRREWVIEVSLRFKGGFEHEEECPILVQTAPEKP